MFKFARRGAGQSPIVSALAAPLPPGHADRRDLLHQISNFLLDHGLEVNPANLALAQGVVSGSNARLGRLVEARRLAGEPVTQAWLNEVTGGVEEANGKSAEGSERDELDWLIGRLDQSLQLYSRSAGEAGNSASDFHAALYETAIAAPDGDLAQLTRSMIERARGVEAEMRRREGEAAAMRESLLLARPEVAVDHLTGLDSQRAFDAVLERAWQAARVSDEPLSIAFCDIDRLPLIIDEHGQDTGDRVIQAIARVLQRIAGANCHIARRGGEEFMLLFRGFTAEEAGYELNDAREKFSQRKLVDRKTHIAVGVVTFSGGVANAMAYQDARTALKAADNALEEAREQGRNRIVLARV